MSSFFDTWRRHLLLWALPLGFCLLNVLGVVFYRWAFAGQVERLERRYERTEETLAALKEEQVVIESFLARLERHQDQVQALHRDRFQTEEQRFIEVIQEVKRLARRAGLRPTSLSYPRRSFAGQDLSQRSINFSVKGTYDQLRTFINFLELTDHFIILNSVSLGDSGKESRDPSLSIRFLVSTIFTRRQLDAPAAPEETQS